MNESIGKNKTAKLWFKTDDVEDPDTYKIFKNFINSFKNKFEIIKEANETFDGKTTLTIYFEKLTDKPYIKLSVEDMELLANNHINFEVDFRF